MIDFYGMRLVVISFAIDLVTNLTFVTLINPQGNLLYL